jgi:hypothetical protein
MKIPLLRVPRLSPFVFIFLSAGLPVIPARTPSENLPKNVSTLEPFRIVERGPNHRVLETVTWEQTQFGMVGRTNRITELASGMHYLDQITGAYEESVPAFEIDGNGYAIARRGPVQAIVSPLLNDASGAVRLVTPEGPVLRSTIAGLNLFNRATGETKLLAEVSPGATGTLIASNAIIFSNCFSGIRASVRYVYQRGEWHQDVLLAERLKAVELESAGFPPEDTVLEIWTEFFEAPAPLIKERFIKGEKNEARRLAMVEPDILNQDLDFGTLKMPMGRAYLLGASRSRALEVIAAKRWATVEGRNFLIEAIPLKRLEPLLAALPSSSSLKKSGQRMWAGRKPPQRELAAKGSQNFQVAKVSDPALHERESKAEVLLVLDYQTINGSLTNFIFKSNEDYIVSGPTHLYGQTVFEGNTVVRYEQGVGATLSFYDPAEFQTDFYRPAIFTAYDDRTVGQSVEVGSGSPSGYYAETALDFYNDGDVVVKHAHIAYAETAILFRNSNGSGDTGMTARHVQIRDSQAGLNGDGWFSDAYVTAGNVLFANVRFPFIGTIWHGAAEHITIDRCSTLTTDLNEEDGSGDLVLYNSILSNVTNMISPSNVVLSGSHNAFFNTASTFGSNVISLSSSPFQIAKDGQYYLAQDSSLQNAGKTNISSWLLDDLKTTTTYPPLVFSNQTFSVATTLAPQAGRDTSFPDLGWHYAPLDYAFGGCETTANIRFAPGTAIARFRTSSGWYHAGHGIHIGDYQTLTLDGSVEQPVTVVRTTSVQERRNGQFEGYGPGGFTGWAASRAASPTLIANHTRFSSPDRGGNNNAFRDDWGYLIARTTHCEYFAGGAGGYGTGHYHTNCLFNRTSVGIESGAADNDLILRNCTWREGDLFVNRYSGIMMPVSVRDCAFDGTTFSVQDVLVTNSIVSDYNYNAFLTNAPSTRPTGSNDVLVASFNWQSGPLGNFYLPTNSTLVNTGSVVNAASIAMYHLTTTTNQTKEATSRIDIGKHYVAVDAQGKPVDTDGDGTPDYVEDENGDGAPGSGETDWQNAADPGLRVRILRPRDGGNIP